MKNAPDKLQWHPAFCAAAGLEFHEDIERLEIYCRANGILRKEFVSLALEYFERTGFDLKSNALD